MKPPKRGHFGIGPFVLSREVVLSQRFVFKCYRNFILIENRVYTYLYTISIHTHIAIITGSYNASLEYIIVIIISYYIVKVKGGLSRCN